MLDLIETKVIELGTIERPSRWIRRKNFKSFFDWMKGTQYVLFVDYFYTRKSFVFVWYIGLILKLTNCMKKSKLGFSISLKFDDQKYVTYGMVQSKIYWIIILIYNHYVTFTIWYYNLIRTMCYVVTRNLTKNYTRT